MTTFLLAASLALLDAAYRDDMAAVETLLNSGAPSNEANDLGATPLWAACRNGNAAMAARLLEAGANPNLSLLRGESPMMIAARGGYARVVELLLARRADPNARAPRGQTALMWAAAHRHANVVELLVRGGADVNARTTQWTEMMAVPPHGYRPYNKEIPHGSETALLFAARAGDLESVDILLRHGGNANDADAWGVTALTYAAHGGYTGLVESLLRRGADPNRMEAGFSPLHIAILRRDERMAQALLEHGADANAKLQTWTPERRSSQDLHFDPALVGASPFWLAARYQNPGVLRLLAARGAERAVIHHSVRVRDATGAARRESTGALLAAMEMGGGGPAWTPLPRAEVERRILETVKTLVDLGLPVDERAVEAANARKLKPVAEFLAAVGKPAATMRPLKK